MEKPQQVPPEFSDRHDVVQTICLWRSRTCYRLEILRRFGKSEENAYVAMLWVEEEQGGNRRLVRDVSFPWTHHDSAEAAVEQALESLTAKLRYASVGETEV
jgi:hypothetical protein